MGSTGVPINLHRDAEIVAVCDQIGGGAASSDDMAGGAHLVGKGDCEALQLSFSSEHPGMTQVVMCDGSVQTVQEDIDANIWQQMGSRAEKFDR
jgi:prepilin-type processing-associated H-X9-DG protein